MATDLKALAERVLAWKVALWPANERISLYVKALKPEIADELARGCLELLAERDAALRERELAQGNARAACMLLDGVTKERDELRAEVERLRAENREMAKAKENEGEGTTLRVSQSYGGKLTALRGERDAARRERDEARNARPDRDYEIMREERDQAIDEVQRLRKECDGLRAAWQQVIADVIATRMWRRGGMRPSTDTSPFSSLPPSVLRDMERRARTALARHEPARCPNCGGPADNGFDRELPPNAYYCTKCSDSAVGEE